MTRPRTQTAADALNEVAADWAIRLETHAGDPEVALALEAWLAEDSRRGGAFLRAQAALSYLDRGRALAGREVPTYDRRRGKTYVSRRGLIAASSLLAVGGASLAAWRLFGRPERYDTKLGEVRRVQLADGSLAILNTQSRVAVDLKSKVRSISLRDGEAWFKVAHDSRRPFIVRAGPVEVRAVGTAFAVRRRDDGADVMVTEGVVETWVVGHEDRKQRLSAGSRAFVSPPEPIQAVAAQEEIDHALAWREGQIALYGETLADAAAEFNRYNAKKVVITDPSLAGEKIVGQFRLDEPEAFARAAGLTLHAKVEDDGQTLTLSSR